MLCFSGKRGHLIFFWVLLSQAWISSSDVGRFSTFLVGIGEIPAVSCCCRFVRQNFPSRNNSGYILRFLGFEGAKNSLPVTFNQRWGLVIGKFANASYFIFQGRKIGKQQNWLIFIRLSQLTPSLSLYIYIYIYIGKVGWLSNIFVRGLLGKWFYMPIYV